MCVITDAVSRIDWKVVEELSHIPAGKKHSLQDDLRIEYAAYRTIHRQLEADLPARAALMQAVYNIRRSHPRFKPHYDEAFFFGGSRMSMTLAGDPLVEEIQAVAAAGGQGKTKVKLGSLPSREVPIAATEMLSA